MSTWREQLASNALRERLNDLERSDSEVRVLRLILGESKFYEWALSIGTIRDPALRSLVPPLPPAALRRITAEEAPEVFLWTGLSDVECLLGLYYKYAKERSFGQCYTRPRLLDFGCGCGRLLRFLTKHDNSLELHGSDVNPDHIQWCREFLTPISFARNAPQPPLSYPVGWFDGIWSLSVFTHLNEGAGQAWRGELARVLSPMGILLATTHGSAALARIASDPAVAASTRLDSQGLSAVRREISERGFAFVPYARDALAAASAGDEYGLSFVSREHVAQTWADEHLEIVAHLPGGLRGWQDIVVMRRKS